MAQRGMNPERALENLAKFEQPLIGILELSQICEVVRETVQGWRTNKTGPVETASLNIGPVWTKQVIEEWLKARLNRLEGSEKQGPRQSHFDLFRESLKDELSTEFDDYPDIFWWPRKDIAKAALVMALAFKRGTLAPYDRSSMRVCRKLGLDYTGKALQLYLTDGPFADEIGASEVEAWKKKFIKRKFAKGTFDAGELPELTD